MVETESLAFVNGRVLTEAGEVEALLIEGGQVVAVGSSTAIARASPTGVHRTHLGGRLVLPGLIDAHMHLKECVTAEAGVDLRPCRTIAELVERLAASARTEPLGPILGWGWDQEHLAEHRYPTRAELDRVSADRPVVAYRICRHVAVANSPALEFAGLSERSPDPPRGHLGRDAGGLDGLLAEAALLALRPLEAAVFAARPHLVRELLERAASYGLTTLAPLSAEPGELSVVEDALRRVGYPVRLRAFVRAGAQLSPARLASLRTGTALRVVGVKIHADGSLGARTAWLSEPYSDLPDELPWGHVAPEELEEAVRGATARELPVAIHAIGDRALANALAVLASERTVGSPRVEHASLVPPDLLEELVRRRPIVVVQPRFVTSDAWIPERLGPERARFTYRFRTFLARGLTVAGSSDAPIEPLDPWTGLQAAVAPRPPWAPGEELSAEQALGLYTTGAAPAVGGGVGTLAPGAPADFVVLTSPRLAAAIDLGAAGVEATYRDGIASYVRSNSTAGESPTRRG
jgi:predicted amidohydrolase YtcJ